LKQSEKRDLVEADNPGLTIKRQCELLELSRSNYYYEPVKKVYSQELVNALEDIYEDMPFYGYRKIIPELLKRGIECGQRMILNLKKILGLKTIYPKRKTTIPNKEHKKYPYLLREVIIEKPNQVWCTDITYLKLAGGGTAYLVAIKDWYSRKILSYRISNTMEKSFCIDALNEALYKYGKPEIFNSDQGSQFTSEAFTNILKSHEIKISMDGKGRWADNIIIERFFRSLKYEEFYMKSYQSLREAKTEIGKYIKFFNSERFHSSIGYKTPDEVYFESKYHYVFKICQKIKKTKSEKDYYLSQVSA